MQRTVFNLPQYLAVLTSSPKILTCCRPTFQTPSVSLLINCSTVFLTSLLSTQPTTSSVSYLMLPGRVKISSTHTILPPGEPALLAVEKSPLLAPQPAASRTKPPQRDTAPRLLDDDAETPPSGSQTAGHTAREAAEAQADGSVSRVGGAESV